MSSQTHKNQNLSNGTTNSKDTDNYKINTVEIRRSLRLAKRTFLLWRPWKCMIQICYGNQDWLEAGHLLFWLQNCVHTKTLLFSWAIPSQKWTMAEVQVKACFCKMEDTFGEWPTQWFSPTSLVNNCTTVWTLSGKSSYLFFTNVRPAENMKVLIYLVFSSVFFIDMSFSKSLAYLIWYWCMIFRKLKLTPISGARNFLRKWVMKWGFVTHSLPAE